jgi:predicted RNA-binding protein with RPS1 domain
LRRSQEVGEVYRSKVRLLFSPTALSLIMPGKKTVLLHISEVTHRRIQTLEACWRWAGY